MYMYSGKVYTHRMKRVTACTLSCLLLLSVAVILLYPISAAETDTDRQADAEDSPNTFCTVVALPPSVLLNQVLYTPIDSVEEQWLDAEGRGLWEDDESLQYTSAVPHENVTLEIAEDGRLTVQALVYRTEDPAMVWTPQAVICGDVVYPFDRVNGDTYELTISPIEGELVHVQVEYRTSLTPSTGIVTTLLNAAYLGGGELTRMEDNYRTALAAYEDASAAYGEYRLALQQYREDSKLYKVYQNEMRLYEQRLAVYHAYLDSLDLYYENMAVYEEYLEEKAVYDKANETYLEFLYYPEEYEKKYLAYCGWLEDMETVRLQLSYMDSCFVRDSVGHVLNSTLNGPTVATVVSRQNELVAAGCDAQDIAIADAATAALIQLLADYPRDGDEKARYTYYVEHYVEFKTNVTDLYSSLYRLYSNKLVPTVLDMAGKKQRYWQFVGQLYALSCAIEDDLVFDEDWRMDDGVLTDLLEECYLLPDENRATPLSAYPPPMEEVIAPADMTKPIPPEVVVKPTMPAPFPQPTPPEAVEEPVSPTPVADPGIRPVPPVYSEREVALMQAVEDQTLTWRETVTEPVEIPLTVRVDKLTTAGDSAVVGFYDYDHMTLLQGFGVMIGDTVDMPEEDPTRPTDARYVYTFGGWMDEQGTVYGSETASMVIEADTYLYANYSAFKKVCTITWVVDGEKTTETYAYGEIPEYPGEPEKEQDTDYTYRFVGWTPEVVPVSRDMTYTAVFEATGRTYHVTWIVGEAEFSETYLAAEIPVFTEEVHLPMDGRYGYVIQGWTPDITAVSDHTIYTAILEAVDLLQGRDDGLVTEKDDEVCLTLSAGGDPLIPVAHLADYVCATHGSLTLRMDPYSITFDYATVCLLAESSVTHLRLEITENTLTILFQNEDRDPISIDVYGSLRISQTDGQGYMLTDSEGNAISTSGEETMEATVSAGVTYGLYHGHPIDVTTTLSGKPDDHGTGGICWVSRPLAVEGEIIEFQITTVPGYRVNTVTVYDKAGLVLYTFAESEETIQFAMPAGGVDVVADFVPVLYTVNFTVDGEVVSSRTYFYGEMPVCPADPTRPSDELYRYAFIGWEPAVTVVMGDITYEAQFKAVSLHDVGESGWIGVIGLGLIILGVALFGYIGLRIFRCVKSRQAGRITKDEVAEADGSDPNSP